LRSATYRTYIGARGEQKFLSTVATPVANVTILIAHVWDEETLIGARTEVSGRRCDGGRDTILQMIRHRRRRRRRRRGRTPRYGDALHARTLETTHFLKRSAVWTHVL
jgi:hypothetical protein